MVNGRYISSRPGFIEEKLAERMVNMTLDEQKEFLRKVREGKIKIA